MADDTPTRVLILRVRSGDKAAINDLYERYVQRVLAAVRARLGPELRQKVESWDIVQDALLASLQNVHAFDYETEGAFVRWLSQIAENRIRDACRFHRADRRDQRREQAVEPEVNSGRQLKPIPDVRLPSPSEILSLREDLSLLERALDLLPADAREIITAVKIEGRTYVEIARETGKSQDAIRMQVNRAMVALTRAFQQLGASPA